MIDSDPDLEVVDTARNGADGVEKAQRLKPDLVTLDIEMPVMDGLTALPEILKSGAAVVMCSSLTTKGSEAALEALSAGAADVIAKDCSFASAEIDQIRDLLVSKLRAIGAARGAQTRGERRGVVSSSTAFELGESGIDLVLIGSSTGGPPVLEEIISALPPELSVPVVIAQHMPGVFTKSMASRLDDKSAMTVVHADAVMPLLPGCVYVIQGGKHGKIKPAGTGRYSLRITDEPAGALYKPCINELFSSAATVARSRVLACVLTGMGDDGRLGAEQIRGAGGRVIAQEAATCVVYGMPKAVCDAGVAEAMLPPSAIALTIGRLVTRTGGVRRAG